MGKRNRGATPSRGHKRLREQVAASFTAADLGRSAVLHFRPNALDPFCAAALRPAFGSERLFVHVDVVPCQVCSSTEDTDFLLCDGCNGGSHLACGGLESVPDGFWVCKKCRNQPLVDSAMRQVC